MNKDIIILQEKTDKSFLNGLPRALFDGRIITVTTSRDADKAVDYLMSCPILGFDTETRPTFKRGQSHAVALLQVSTPDTAFLFRINLTGITDSIKRLLEDKKITKVGLSLHDDFHQLRQRREFITGTFIDIQNEAKEVGIADMSLQKIYANLFHEKISKAQQLSNWEADILTDAQKLYAATDAWACIRIHQRLKELLDSGDYIIEKSVSEEEETV